MKRSVFRVALITLFCILPSLFANTDPEEFALEPLVNSSNKVPAPRTIVNQVMEIEMFSNGLSLGSVLQWSAPWQSSTTRRG